MDKLQELEAKVKGMELYESLIMAAVGLAVLLFGYRIKKLAFFIIWFLIGYNLILILMPWIQTFAPEVVNTELYQSLLPIAGGALLALMGFSIEKFCVSALCFALIILITVQYFGTEVPTLAIGAILGGVAGTVAIRMLKPAIILATAIAGGWALTVALLQIFPDINREVFYFPMIAIISAIGAIFQFKTTKRSR